MKTYKVLSALLDYPTAELVEALPELHTALCDEAIVRAGALEKVEALIAALGCGDLMESEARYVDLFDRVRSLSLHLFEHVHGQSRDRGQAMVDLTQLYVQHGFALETSELPDYLPAFLEFLACVPAGEAQALLADATGVLEAIGARLARRGSPYAAVFEALLSIVGGSIAPENVRDEDIRREDDPAALDREWQAEPAFGPAPACGVTRAPAVSVVKLHKGVAA